MQDAAIVKPRQNENQVQCVILESDHVVRIEQLALRAITRLGLILEQCHALPLVAVPMAVGDHIEECLVAVAVEQNGATLMRN